MTVHPLRERRTWVVLAVTCLVGAVAGWTMGSLDASEAVFYAVALLITGVGTVVAILGSSRFRRTPADQAARSRRSARGA